MAKPPINTNLVVMPCDCPCSVGVDPCNCNKASVGVQCRSRSGSYTLIGYDEFVNPSVPPRRYKTVVLSGQLRKNIGYCPITFEGCDFSTVKSTYTVSGSCGYRPDGTRFSNGSLRVVSDLGTTVSDTCDLVSPSTYVCMDEIKTRTSITKQGQGAACTSPDDFTISGSYFRIFGSQTKSLSSEDTESAAIARIARTIVWSDWRPVSGGNACCASRSKRGAGQFSGAWTEAELKLTAKGAPHATAVVEITLVQRPLAGGAAIEEKPNVTIYCDSAGNGEVILGLPSVAGFETCYAGMKQLK